ncbi:MAG: glutamate--tRNA ligase [Candidatus Andersenbacteria bacterium]|nr:glutamate--tRNA ligase [Candidatus Andersenbacteria bacterium]
MAEDKQPAVRVRIAPSPTGPLHVGTARTALFNELFARQHGGSLIVRIEDTDQVRNRAEYEHEITKGLRWLKIMWQEGPDTDGPHGPYRQSERTNLYTAALEGLLQSGRAYSASDSGAIKLQVVPQTVTFTDMVRGKVAMHTDAWGGDFVIAKSLTKPLYHLAVVVDDAEMQITHIIRGEDHLSNTARHILLQQALGYTTPQYAHIPLLLDQQRRKLSKRAGEASVLAYRDRGFLPEAMLNYLALLGWNPKTDQEIFSHGELVDAFRLADVQKSGAIFNLIKLEAINKQYLRRLPPQALLGRAQPYLAQAGITVGKRGDFWRAALATERDRAATLSALAEAVSFFQPDGPAAYPATLLAWRESDRASTRQHLQTLYKLLQGLKPTEFEAEQLKKRLLTWLDGAGLNRGAVLWPLRVALTGKEHSPGPFEVAAVLGKEEVLRRLGQALKLL